MPSSEDLVPTGLPHGSRQQVEGQMQAAGLPLGSSSVGGAAPTPPPEGAVARPAGGSPSPPQGSPLTGFDVFANRQPMSGTNTAPVLDTEIRKQRIMGHPSPFIREVGKRVYGR